MQKCKTIVKQELLFQKWYLKQLCDNLIFERVYYYFQIGYSGGGGGGSDSSNSGDGGSDGSDGERGRFGEGGTGSGLDIDLIPLSNFVIR